MRDRRDDTESRTSPVPRRLFLGGAAAALSAIATSGIGCATPRASSAISPRAGPIAAPAAPTPGKARVFFTRDLTLGGLLSIYGRINQGITGKVGIKLHSGEPHGPNLLPIELIKGLQPRVANSSIVECNVLYPSPRQSASGHREALKTNGFDFCPVDIMDADGDVALPIPGMREFLDKHGAFGMEHRPFTPGVHLTEVAVGRNLVTYDSLVVYTHFKGHAMGGFGGSLKNIAIGCASGRVGKRQIHGDGWPLGKEFLERMVEAGKAITTHFGRRIVYINVLKNISVDCDCDAHGVKPTCDDIGIVGSTDILAVDRASVDLVYAQPEAQRRDIVERIESRGGLRQLEYMKTLQMGSGEYELVRL